MKELKTKPFLRRFGSNWSWPQISKLFAGGGGLGQADHRVLPQTAWGGGPTENRVQHHFVGSVNFFFVFFIVGTYNKVDKGSS